jgi:hypothetical protein
MSMKVMASGLDESFGESSYSQVRVRSKVDF